MSLLEHARTRTPHDGKPASDHRVRPLTVDDADTVDLTAEHAHREPGVREEVDEAPAVDRRPLHGPIEIDPTGRIPWRGMRIRRVRLASVAKLSFIFWLLAFAVLLGSTVLVWNVARAFGFIGEVENAVVTSLGLDAFEIDGGALFGIAAAVVAFITLLGWVMTIMLAAVYNASCAVFGGLAVETGPLQRRKRVFSLRHRSFVTVRS